MRSPGRGRYGTAGARTDVGQVIVVAPGRAAGQVEPEAQLGEQRQLPADIDFGPMLALQRFEEREQSLVAGRMRLPFRHGTRSEEHTSELQSLMRISYAVFCLKKKNTPQRNATQECTQLITNHNNKTDTQA